MEAFCPGTENSSGIWHLQATPWHGWTAYTRSGVWGFFGWRIWRWQIHILCYHIKGLDFHAMLKVSYPVEEIASVTNVVPCRRVGSLAHHSCSKQYEEIFSSMRYYSSLYCLMLFRPGALQLTFAFTSMVALTQWYIFWQPSVRKSWYSTATGFGKCFFGNILYQCNGKISTTIGGVIVRRSCQQWYYRSSRLWH